MNARFSLGRRKIKVGLLKKAACFFLFISIVLLMMYNFQIIPILTPIAEAQSSTMITAITQRIVRETFGSGSEIVNIKYDKNGNVVSLETNTALVSSISAKIAEKATNELTKSDKLEVKIPVGTLSGGALFTGRGPDIIIPIAVSPKITCEIENEFIESGINQTLHRIIAELEIEALLLLPIAPKKIEVETEYCIAETVIVGKIPDAYTEINRSNDNISESDIDDLYDFGAVSE